MTHYEQGSAEWHAARAGKATASRMADIFARTKSGWGASRGTYLAQLVAERLTGQVSESYTNTAMQWGVSTEPEARDAYAFYSGHTVSLVGFVDHPTVAMTGASPDGLVGTDGLVELKCPQTKTHIETLLGGTIPDAYRKQMLWQMACTERSWCDFVSYDPRMPEDLRLFVRRLPRDDDAITEMVDGVRQFLSEVDATVDRLMALRSKAAA